METIDSIIALEWNMFQRVNNEGGRASCQDDIQTFRIMRKSQFAAWPETVQKSYLNDLETAQTNGRNLVMEKYARMMESTAPERFAEISGFLPPLGDIEKQTIAIIVGIQMKWTREFALKYPNITGRGRAVSSDLDNEYNTSIETYLRCELATYSLDTLKLLLAFFANLEAAGKNLTEEILLNTADNYGFRSLENAETKIAKTCHE